MSLHADFELSFWIWLWTLKFVRGWREKYIFYSPEFGKKMIYFSKHFSLPKIKPQNKKSQSFLILPGGMQKVVSFATLLLVTKRGFILFILLLNKLFVYDLKINLLFTAKVLSWRLSFLLWSPNHAMSQDTNVVLKCCKR